jgi:hypothetical protein
VPSRFRPRLTFANAVSLLALFVALGGGAYAASQLPKGSVGTKQLKDNAVISSKVKNGSLLAKDFKAGQLLLQRLPSGKTIRGAWDVRGGYPMNGAELGTAVSLPVPAPTAIDGAHAKRGGANECRGSVANPTAAPGFACVYASYGVDVFSVSARALPAGPSPYGFSIAVQGSGTYYSLEASGTWAYTAP